MRHTKRIAAAVFAAMIVFTSCDIPFKKENETERPETTTKQTEVTEETEVTTETEPQETQPDPSEPEVEPEVEVKDRAHVSLGYIESDDIGEEQTAELAAAAKELKPIDGKDITMVEDSEDWKLYLCVAKEYQNYTRRLSDVGWVIVDSDLNVYDDSPELSALVKKSLEGGSKDLVNENNEYYTIECKEPNTEEEYVGAAVECCKEWLGSLQSEDTDNYYRNKSFEITEVEEESGHQKCNYLSSGMVDGVKEFVVEICFNAEDCGEDSFYDKYYQEGRYTEAGTYWSGNYFCARFRWEDGKCTLIKIGTRDESKTVQSGLNGIQGEGGYKNFFEFARRPDYDKAVENSFVPYGRCTVSANLTQTEDGKPINIDIYSSKIENETKEGYTAIWDKRAYIDGQATYSTGLYFTDNGTGHMPDTLPKKFSLTFDNYDGDANPDFCCRYDSDSDGTYYVLESIQTDGRIFNLSGRAFEGGIYIAGCTDPSPRLQRTENIPYIGWKKDESGYYPTDSSGQPTELPDLNMYSDRLFLPGDLKLYTKDEDTVTCFIWNNTDSEITTDGTYSIEMSDNGKWKTVAEGLKCKSGKIKPREHIEVSYDISSVKDRYNTVYRIVNKCGSKEACGSFWLEGKEAVSIDVKADAYHLGASSGSFSVKDNGFKETVIKSAYITDGEKNYPLTLFSSDNDSYQFTAEKLPGKAGKYKLVVNDAAECSIKFVSAEAKIPELKAVPSFEGDNIKLTLTCSANAELINIVTYKKLGGNWSAVPFMQGDGVESYLKTGKKSSIVLQNYFTDYFENDEDLREAYEEAMEMFEDDEQNFSDFEKLGITADTSFEEFKEILIKGFSADPEAEYMFVIDYVADDVKYQTYKFT